MIAMNMLVMTTVLKIKDNSSSIGCNYSTYAAFLPSSLSPSVVCTVYVLKTQVVFKVEISSVTGKTLVTRSFTFSEEIKLHNMILGQASSTLLLDIQAAYPLQIFMPFTHYLPSVL